MGVRTRIGIAGLVRSSQGSVELPEEVTLYCPQCGTEAADKGQCLLSLGGVFVPEKKNMEVRLSVDCRVCGCLGEAPVIFPPKR